MEKGAAGAASAIDGRFVENLHILAVVRCVVRDVVDKSTPSTPNPNDPVSIAQRADGDCSYCGIETGDVATTSQNSYRAFRQRNLLVRERE
jgi:hypothetical protein